MIVKCIHSGCNHNEEGICQAESIELVNSNNFDGEGLDCLSYED